MKLQTTSRAISAALLLAILPFLPMPAAAQSGKINPNIPPPPPPSSGKPVPPPEKTAPINPDIPPPPPSSEAVTPKLVFDPIGAKKSVEVGAFYMKKGNYDAAIDRFHDATRQNTAFAEPYLRLGEAYEKKGDPESALKAYKQYLRLYPSSPERKAVEGRIADLEKKPQSAENKQTEK
jgi:tetratricopeptide (TPR) repeat protein